MQVKNKIITGDQEWIETKIKGFAGKELISLPNGSAKLVKIAPGATYPSHIHPDKTEYAHVIDGTLLCKIEAEEFYGNTGDFFVFPTGLYHALSNQSNEDCIVLIGSIKN